MRASYCEMEAMVVWQPESSLWRQADLPSYASRAVFFWVAVSSWQDRLRMVSSCLYLAAIISLRLPYSWLSLFSRS